MFDMELPLAVGFDEDDDDEGEVKRSELDDERDVFRVLWRNSSITFVLWIDELLMVLVLLLLFAPLEERVEVLFSKAVLALLDDVLSLRCCFFMSSFSCSAVNSSISGSSSSPSPSSSSSS